MTRDTVTTPRRRWSQPLADLVDPCLKPAFARFGFDEATLLLGWPDIVGERLAGRCEPLRLQWPRRPPGRAEGGEAATLIVRVEGGFAIELQHQAPVVIERVNAHCGWRAVGRLALRQGPVRGLPARRAAPPPPPATAVALAREQTAAIGESPLRDALVRLGAQVATRAGSAT